MTKSIIKITGVEKTYRDKILLNKTLPKILKSDIEELNLTIDDLDSTKLNKILSYNDNPGFRTQEDALQSLCAETRRARLNKARNIENSADKPKGTSRINSSEEDKG